jgi:hypothetical protein
MTMSAPILFHTTDWDAVPATEYPGETGKALWRTLRYGSLRIRIVEYSENYRANHWCRLGQILYCLTGEMVTELSDGRSFLLKAGMSYQVTDGVSAHRTFSINGGKVLIVDGDFLKAKKEHNPWKM